MIRTSSILFWFCLAIAASLTFYRTNDNVQALEQKLHGLNASIESEQQNIHVLNAEWSYLANPERVEAETHKYLTALRPTVPQQVARIADMADLLPTRGEAMASVDVNATPIANIKSSLTAPTPRHSAAVKTKGTISVASADTGHINDHMIIQHTASTPPPQTDAIGTLINELGSHP